MLQFTFRSFFSFAELHFVPVLDEPTNGSSAQPNQETDQWELSAANRACELDEVKYKASAHKPAHLPAGFSGLRTCTDLKKGS